MNYIMSKLRPTPTPNVAPAPVSTPGYLSLCTYTSTFRGEREGLVLKWYLNSKTVPIYQWIPPHHPRVGRNVLGGFKKLHAKISYN